MRTVSFALLLVLQCGLAVGAMKWAQENLSPVAQDTTGSTLQERDEGDLEVPISETEVGSAFDDISDALRR